MRCLTILLLLLISFAGWCQTRTVLQNNPSLKWYQLNSPNFKVIYPEGFDLQANRMVNTLEHIRQPEANTIGKLPSKISVVLQNQSAVSNGFVSITPRRSEFYAMPSQNYNFTGTNDWLNLLATHEYRHITQFAQANRGFNRLFYYLFGYNTLAAFSYVAVPPWFMEGDAVVTETAFTPSGRGRIPNFNLMFRTNLQSERTFNYEKQMLGSYKHFIPDHYVLGYNMVSYLRKRTNNPDVWENVTKRAWNVPFLPFSFSRAIKKETGLYVKQVFKEMTTDLQQSYKAQQDTLSLNQFELVSKRKSKSYTNYRFPKEIGKDSVLVLRSGIGDIDQLVLLAHGEEKVMFTTGVLNQTGMLSIENDIAVWNEYRYDPRWRVKTYSVIMKYDANKRTTRQVVRHTRYAGAAISPDGKVIATIETDTEYKTNLVLLQASTGLIMEKIPNADNDFLSMPRWSETGEEIIFIITNKNGRSLASYNLKSKQQSMLAAFGQENIGHPVVFKNYVLYNSPVSGIDNIYAIDRISGKRYQITSSRFGAYNPSISIDGKYIYYNDQQANGMDVVKIPLDVSSWNVVIPPLTLIDNSVKHLVEQESSPGLLENIPSVQYKPKRYSRFTHMFNLYNWGGYVNNDLTQATIGIASQDVLSTTQLDIGYTIDLNERTGTWKAGLSYQGFYPIIDFNVSQSDRSVNEGDVPTEEWRINKMKDTTFVKSNQNITFTWKEKNAEIGLRLPLIATQSKYISGLTLSNYVGITSVTGFKNSATDQRYFPAIIRYDTIVQNGKDAARKTILNVYPFFDYVGNNSLVYNNFNASFYRLLKQSPRDINSKWGQSATLSVYGTPYGGDLEGGQLSFTGYLYFPGLFKHHSLWGYWAYQEVLTSANFSEAFDDYLFRNRIPLPRGQAVGRFKKLYTMSGNYTFPTAYPDIALGPLVNIQRIRTNLFLDYGFGQQQLYSGTGRSYLSTGAEVKFDVNIIRLLPQLDIGFRYAYGINPYSSTFEFLLGTFNF